MGSKTKFSASISIRSLVKRETTGYRWLGDETKDFNPLPRKEGDRNVRIAMAVLFLPLHAYIQWGDRNVRIAMAGQIISIRSLVKRETINVIVLLCHTRQFQSAPS